MDRNHNGSVATMALPAALSDTGIVVPAAVVDVLVSLALGSDVGKGIMIGFRTTAGIPLDVPMQIRVTDARLVPTPEVRA